MSAHVSNNALKILEKRKYLWPKSDGTVETPQEMFWRVATVIAGAEGRHFGGSNAEELEIRSNFYEAMVNLRFVPNTPTLLNAGRDRGQLAACFVLPLADSMDGIMDTLKGQALVQKSGGGTGFNFGEIRESGALIKTTQMQAAGPISVILFMNYMMEHFILQGGTRHGANMAVLPTNHYDVFDFIKFKKKDGSCKSFNVSLSASDNFMKAVQEDLPYLLVSRATGASKPVFAREIFDLACEYAWETGDPGLLFEDRANDFNPTPHVGRLEATNPCGEQWLLPNEACVLGHINLSKYFRTIDPDWMDQLDWKDQIDWELMKEDIRLGVRFLDNVIEVNHYPLPEVEQMHRHTNRKIGLGVMGLADLLILLGIRYGSQKSLEVSNEIALFLRTNADLASCDLGRSRGNFGAFEGSVPALIWPHMRNACRCTVAPTGTTAIIAGSSTGIEPVFGLALKRQQAGMTLYEMHPLFEAALKKYPPHVSASILDWLCENGTLRGSAMDPREAELFMQANDVPFAEHIQIQAAWQRHIDNSISKTINMPNSATVQDIKDAYMLAWRLGCKGITVYRDGCRNGQALSQAKVGMGPEIAGATQVSPGLYHVNESTSIFAPQAKMASSFELIIANAPPVDPHQLSALCKECNGILEIAGGCETCKQCGWAACSV